MSKITESARGEDCTLRLDYICNFDPDTTVFAHTGRFGTAKRNHDEVGCYACSDCHDAIDGRTGRFHSDDDRMQERLSRERRFHVDKGEKRTQKKLREKGLIKECDG